MKAAKQGHISYEDILAAFPEAEESLEELEGLFSVFWE